MMMDQTTKALRDALNLIGRLVDNSPDGHPLPRDLEKVFDAGLKALPANVRVPMHTADVRDTLRMRRGAHRTKGLAVIAAKRHRIERALP